MADKIIRNTYRTLMTRGQKGCFVFCTDKDLEQYFIERLKRETMYREYDRDEMQVAENKEDY